MKPLPPKSVQAQRRSLVIRLTLWGVLSLASTFTWWNTASSGFIAQTKSGRYQLVLVSGHATLLFNNRIFEEYGLSFGFHQSVGPLGFGNESASLSNRPTPVTFEHFTRVDDTSSPFLARLMRLDVDYFLLGFGIRKDLKIFMGPFWFSTCVPAGFMLVALYRYHRNFRLPGHCPICNYDLRATPARCPECGHIVATK